MRRQKPGLPVESKELKLDISEPERILPVAKALSSMERLRILRCLGLRSMNVQELAQALDLPVSSTALHVRVLEESGLIMSENLPASRGAMKLCSRRLDLFSCNMVETFSTESSVLSLEMPVGGFSRTIDLAPTCGMASVYSAIGDFDTPSCFYLPGRFGAEIIWFREGFVEYLFGVMNLASMDIHWLELSFEACSEAPMHRNPWKSDISVFINDKRIGIWTSPADLGGRRGLLNPEWWPDVSTQFGLLKTWRVDRDCCYVDNVRVSDLTIKDLDLKAQTHINIKIGVEKDAENAGGINLFGRNFGDYPQGIILKIGYSIP